MNKIITIGSFLLVLSAFSGISLEISETSFYLKSGNPSKKLPIDSKIVSFAEESNKLEEETEQFSDFPILGSLRRKQNTNLVFLYFDSDYSHEVFFQQSLKGSPSLPRSPPVRS